MHRNLEKHIVMRITQQAHGASIRRCNNIADVQTTLYQRQNEIVFLLGID